MLAKISIGLASVIAVLLIVIATRPADFHYSRSATITASPAVVFEHVNDLHKFQTWNPWAKIDPNAKGSFSGPPSGVGSAFSWAGNNEVGEGTMTLIESRPGELVRFNMDFRKPMAGTSTAEFTFKPDGDKTTVTWSMFGPNNFMGKAMSLVIDCEKMVGDQFSKGLESLKRQVEVPANP
jgi:uncharacterized protein YndB with AHSA1/START domain